MAPLIRPSTTAALRTRSLISANGQYRSVIRLSRPLSTTAPLRSGDGHESHYDPPTGWLWGVPPGEKPPKEGWENIMLWGFYGSLGLTAVLYCFKPDTNIETWALEEAKRRLQAEGTIPEDE